MWDGPWHCQGGSANDCRGFPLSIWIKRVSRLPCWEFAGLAAILHWRMSPILMQAGGWGIPSGAKIGRLATRAAYVTAVAAPAASADSRHRSAISISDARCSFGSSRCANRSRTSANVRYRSPSCIGAGNQRLLTFWFPGSRNFSRMLPRVKPASGLCVCGAQSGPSARAKDNGFRDANDLQAMRARNANRGGDRVVWTRTGPAGLPMYRMRGQRQHSGLSRGEQSGGGP